MKDFAEIIGEPYAGQQKSKQEIREGTRARIPQPADYEYGKKLPEWDSSLPAGAKVLLRDWQPLSDRIIVKLIDEPETGRIHLTDRKQLIGGDLRKAIVLKVGPGRWIPGEWWKVNIGRITYSGKEALKPGYDVFQWQWFPGYRRPISIQLGQTVFIGNWVDLEADGVCLCQEADVRAIVWGT